MNFSTSGAPITVLKLSTFSMSTEYMPLWKREKEKLSCMQASDQLATKAPAVASNDAGQESPPDLVCAAVVLEERGDERENDGETQQV